MLPILFMIPSIDGVTIHTAAPVNPEIAPIVVPITTPAFLNSDVPVEIGDGVTLTFTDGFTVTMSKESADFALNPPIETDEEYGARLCRQLIEAKPYIDWSC